MGSAALWWIAIAMVPLSSGSTPDARRSAEPGIRLHATALSDFYFTLRAASGSDSASNLPQSTLAAAARLNGLTEFLPDSLPLKTQANTVLIVHRKNPKYTATIDRLLWRRLDPGLGTLQSPEEMSRVLPDIAASLQPLCGSGADSIRIALNELYKSTYPLYLTSTWPLHRRETSAWIREFEGLFLPREKDALSALSKQLAVPLGDTSQVRIFVVSSAVPDDGVLYASKDLSYVSIVIPARESGYRAVGRILRWYLKGSELIATDSSATLLRILDRKLQEAHAAPALMRELPDALIAHAIGKLVADQYGSDELLGAAGDGPPYMPALRRAWSAHISGALSVDETCRSIVEAATRPAAPREPAGSPASGSAK